MFLSNEPTIFVWFIDVQRVTPANQTVGMSEIFSTISQLMNANQDIDPIMGLSNRFHHDFIIIDHH